MHVKQWAQAPQDGCEGKLRIVSEVTEHTKNRHLQIANILAHSNGQILISCRWDHRAVSEEPGRRIVWRNGEQLGQSAEGDCTNEQALFFSTDGGATFQIANDGQSIVTLAMGTSFAMPSAVTHSLLFEDAMGQTWLYYTIDQPMTCGKAYPWRATGGGEIRRIRLRFDGRTWRAAGESGVVWGCMQPLPDGAGGTAQTVRVSCLNAILSLGGGRLLMPVSGRDTVAEPDGCYWRENRAWMLISADSGATWDRAAFVGGSSHICLCEGTVVQTGKGHLFSLMRAGYGTGESLYAAWSRDGGDTWETPVPTGLPNAKTGTRPFLLRLRSGNYLLLQTDEHETSHRVNLTAFVTDEEGLYKGLWKWKRVLSTDCKSLWKGSAYGAAAQDAQGGIHVAFAGFTSRYNRLYSLRVTEQWLTDCLYEPSGGMLEEEDGRPCWILADAAPILRFTNTRGRAQAGSFGALRGKRFADMRVSIRACPEAGRFSILSLRSFCGSREEIAILLAKEDVLLEDASGTAVLGAPGENRRLYVEILGANRYVVHWDGTCLFAYGKAYGDPDTLVTGGDYAHGEACLMDVTNIAYGSSAGE